MPPTSVAPDGTPVATVHHRGRILQVFLAPWTRHLTADREKTETHLHVQDLDGGPGQILALDSPQAQELAAFHPEVANLTLAPSAPEPPPAPPVLATYPTPAGGSPGFPLAPTAAEAQAVADYRANPPYPSQYDGPPLPPAAPAKTGLFSRLTG